MKHSGSKVVQLTMGCFKQANRILCFHSLIMTTLRSITNKTCFSAQVVVNMLQKNLFVLLAVHISSYMDRSGKFEGEHSRS